ncbi:MAG: peptidase glycoprotease [Frankiales bacterium]|nr:peptidase glycoprotease [Frankiales bacterium]
MLVLALDTSSPAVSVGLVDLAPGAGPEAVPQWGREASWRVVDGGKHGELLATGIDVVLRELVAQPADLAAVVVGLGPGPFTGLRVGIMTAAAMADALDIPAYGVCSLDAVDDWDTDGPRVVVTDARRKEVYWAEYADDGERVAGPSVMRPADLVAALAATRWDDRVVGAGARQYSFAGAAEPSYPDPGHLVLAAASRILGHAPSETLVPLYLRRPDATPPGAPKRATA